MAVDLDDEILQDFLVEAGELLEQLGEQLVALEKNPDDRELLNAVFRNFHTVKGGAGFLALDALVEVCHRAEDVFNLLRTGERRVDAALMDVVLRAYDAINSMIDDIRNGKDAQHANPEIIAQLERFANGEIIAGLASTETSTADVAFDAMLDAVAADVADEPVASVAAAVVEEEVLVSAQAPAAAVDDLFGFDEPAAPAAQSDEITEDEFEALLDQLHGSSAPNVPSSAASKAEPVARATSGSGDLITDDEFENLLDELNAKKKTGGGVAAVAVSAAPSPTPSIAPSAAVKPTAPAPVKKEIKPAFVVDKPKVVADVEKADVKATQSEGKADAQEGKGGASKDAAADTTVRVDTKRLDDIMNLVGELVLVRNRLATLRGNMSDEVSKTVANLDLVTSDLQNAVMKTRMQPIKKVFGRFPRVVRDLARSLNKQVTLELIGEETDLDKNLVEALADPLVHLVRNAVDHGIEDPETRRRAGKPETGTVKLSAEQEGDHILLMIEDDGAGMSPDVLRRKAVEKGLLDEDSAARLDDNACYNLIFAPGFSTKTEISDISGRGVGMDVVKTRITQLNGTLSINSKLGHGSTIMIKVPLTLAIMPTLMVKLGKQVFALPLANVIEIFDRESARTSTVDGKDVVIVREKALPLVFLSKWLVRDSSYSMPDAHDGYVVVVSYGSRHIGCVVDQLIGQEEVVIKPLGTMLQGTKGLSGATITGNGRIALILDMPGLMEAYGRR